MSNISQGRLSCSRFRAVVGDIVTTHPPGTRATNEGPAGRAGESSAVRTAIWAFPDKPVAELVRAAQIAEAVGIDTFWVGDEGPAREAFTVLTAVGIATRSINLGVAVTNP